MSSIDDQVIVRGNELRCPSMSEALVVVIDFAETLRGWKFLTSRQPLPRRAMKPELINNKSHSPDCLESGFIVLFQIRLFA
jgi:hypothetical protein